ncbi:unnamed protein product [Cochlearia groenlandica]
MYGNSGLMLHYMQNSYSDIHQFEDLFKSYKLSDDITFFEESNMSNTFAESSNMSDYNNIGEEGDLFKAQDKILQDSILAVDSQALCSLPDLDLDLDCNGQQLLLDKAFYECEQELMTMESPFSGVLDIKNISVVAVANTISESQDMHKSLSSGNLSSMMMDDCSKTQQQQENLVIQNFPGFGPFDYGMRRAFSEGDIQRLGAGLVQSPLDMIIVSCTSEDRREKLSRYRNKKSRRNFGRKIKYACRKALADNQPRIRGRFAKTEERK